MARAKVDEVVFEGDSIEAVSEAASPVYQNFNALYEKACAPFDKTYQRQIPGGATMTYITGEQAQSRMTEAYGHHWDWAIDGPPVITDTDVLVYGTLSVRTPDPDGSYGGMIRRAGFGGQRIKKRSNSNDILDLGNDVKAAETGAFKRAAAKFGVGLYLYEKGESDEVPQSYGSAGSYSANRAPVQFGSSAANDANGTTGPIEFISMPKIGPDGKQKLGGIKIGDTWFNVSNRAPINLGQFQKGQVVHIAHAPGNTFIDAISVGQPGSPMAGDEIEAF